MFTRVDDRLHDHPKFLKCSLSARGLWVTALSWVGDKLTDGFVPHRLRASQLPGAVGR